ncbi:MAG: hypothetical protein U5K32_11610 [Bacteroidales bacterium]|nr:hypothetical protein [Bacteroidales bacterium]
MKKYPLFSKKNISSYLAVMLVWVLISVISSFLLYQLVSGVTYWVLLIWAAITTMLGMMIMFGASVINLRKLSPGFKRLAAGENNPNIPPVWCPVLTAATNAAMELAEVKNESK